jgi:glycosyltransferase involved in cell wall biosynthesis
MTPDVSVLTPAYNAELTLERAVRSALDQQGVDVQVVIVDDASTDGTGDLMQQWVAPEPSKIIPGSHVKPYRRITNGRIAATLNTAGEKADGKYFVRCDTDDWLERGSLARMATVLDANPDIGFVYGQRRYYGRRSDTYTPRPFNADDFNVHNAAGYCYMFRREIWDAGLRWKALGTFGGKVIDLEDWQHLLAMIGMGYKGMSMPDTLVLHYCFRWDGTWQELQDVQPEALAELKARFPSVRATSL